MQSSNQLQTHGCSLETGSATPPNPHSLLSIPAAGGKGGLGHVSSPEYGAWKFPLLLAVALDLRVELGLQLLHEEWSLCLRGLSSHIAAPRGEVVTDCETHPHAFRAEGGEPYRIHSSGDIENWWHRPLQSSLSLSLGFALNSWMPPDACRPHREGGMRL